MLRIAFAGTPEFALPALRALAASPHELVGVLTQPDRPAGRGAAGRPRELKASPVKRLAGELGLSLAQPARLKSEDERAPLLRWASDLLVVVAYGLLLPRAVLELPRLGCLNIHASLLPRWRGAAPIQRAILAGDRETGVTIMQMDEGLDTGAMLAQRRLAVGDHTDAGQLHASLAELGAQLLLDTLDAVEAGRVHAEPQPEQGLYFRSDNFSFANGGVPALYERGGLDDTARGPIWGRAQLEDFMAHRYRQPTDQYSPDWDVRGAIDDLRLYYEVGLRVARSRRFPRWYSNSEFRVSRDSKAAP